MSVGKIEKFFFYRVKCGDTTIEIFRGAFPSFAFSFALFPNFKLANCTWPGTGISRREELFFTFILNYLRGRARAFHIFHILM